MPSYREGKIIGYAMIPKACSYPWPPTFVGRWGWWLFLFCLSLPHFAVRWEMLREALNSLVLDPTNEGASRLTKKNCDTLYSPDCLTAKESTVMAKLRYCERVHTDFPVVFAGEAYVGEGTALNVSVPGCAIHSQKRVMVGSYLEMRMLVPDATSPLRVGLAKVRWCKGRRFGVEFIQMPGEDQIRLGRLVKKEVPLALPPQSRIWQEAHS